MGSSLFTKPKSFEFFWQYDEEKDRVWTSFSEESKELEQHYQEYLKNEFKNQIDWVIGGKKIILNFENREILNYTDKKKIGRFKRVRTPTQFFWQSNKDPFDDKQIKEWTPFPEEEQDRIEKYYQIYLDDPDPSKNQKNQIPWNLHNESCILDFDQWMIINKNDGKKQIPFKRDLPENNFTIKRKRFNEAIENNNNKPKFLRLKEQNTKDLFITMEFDIFEDKSLHVKVKYLNKLGFFVNLVKFKKFLKKLSEEIQILSKTNKKKNIFENDLKSIEEENQFYGVIFKMYTKESFLYKCVNKYLRNYSSNKLQDIPYYFSSLMAALTYYSKDNKSLFEKDGFLKSGATSIQVYRGLTLSSEILEEFKESVGEIDIGHDFYSTSLSIYTALNFSLSNKNEKKVLIKINIPLKLNEEFCYINHLSVYKEKEVLIRSGVIAEWKKVEFDQEKKIYIFEVELLELEEAMKKIKQSWLSWTKHYCNIF